MSYHPHARIIDRLGGTGRVANLLNANEESVFKWRRRGIPYKHFHRIVAFEVGVTAEWLDSTKRPRRVSAP